MTKKIKLSFAAAISACFPLSIAHAQEENTDQSGNYVAVGVGFIDQHTPFNSASSQGTVIPLISVKQGAFYIEVAEAGVQLQKEMGGIKPSLNLFVAARSPSGRDRQKVTADAGARISLESQLGIISAEIRHDVTDKFNGSEIIARFSHPISTGRFRIIPSVQASWLDQKAANYMYGITAQQRARMIEKKRRVILPVAAIADDALNFGGDIAVAFQASQRLTLIAAVGGTYLDKSIRKSPAIEQKWEAQSILGLTYRF
jgi:MipA family protein